MKVPQLDLKVQYASIRAEAEAAILRGLVSLNRKRYEESIRHLITAKARLSEELRLQEAARRAKEKVA